METTDSNQLYLELYNTVQENLSGMINAQNITQIVEKISREFENNLYSELLLRFYTQSRENYLLTHITNTVILALGFGHSLSLSAEDRIDLGLCAFGHDFAMAEYLPFFQKPGELSTEEARLVRGHTQKSATLFKAHFPEKVIQGILDVHEQADGNGYPAGKSDIEVSFLSKIISICDVFEALTHARSFRAEVNPYEAIKLIIKKKNTVFDGQVINRFVDFMSIYPIGTLVHLNTGEIGLVVAGNYAAPTRCVVKVLLTAQRNPETTLKIHNLLENKMVYVIGTLPTTEEKEIIEALNPRGNISL